MNFLCPSLFFFLFFSLFFPLLNCVCVLSHRSSACSVILSLLLLLLSLLLILNWHESRVGQLFAGLSEQPRWCPAPAVLSLVLGSALRAPVYAAKWVLLKPSSPWKGTRGHTAAAHPQPLSSHLASRQVTFSKDQASLRSSRSPRSPLPRFAKCGPGVAPNQSPWILAKEGLLESPLSLVRPMRCPLRRLPPPSVVAGLRSWGLQRTCEALAAFSSSGNDVSLAQFCCCFRGIPERKKGAILKTRVGSLLGNRLCFSHRLTDIWSLLQGSTVLAAGVSMVSICAVQQHSQLGPWTHERWLVWRRGGIFNFTQAPPSMGFSSREYWSGLPFPSPGDLPDPGMKPRSPALAGRFFAIWATREA